MGLISNVKEKLEFWFFKVARDNGFVREDYVCRIVHDEVEEAVSDFVGSDWIMDVENSVEENESNINDLYEKVRDINYDSDYVTDLDNKVERIDGDIDTIFVACGYLEEFLLAKYPKDEDKIRDIFRKINNTKKYGLM